MKLLTKGCNLEDEKQVDALEVFAPKVRKILRQSKEERKLASIANRLGFHPSRLTEMITQNGNGQYKRRITPNYLAKFFDGNVMDMDQVLGRRKLEALPDRARLFFERMMLSRKTIRLVVEAQRKAIGVDKILEAVLSSQSDG